MRDRIRRSRPALVVAAATLLFWPGTLSARERWSPEKAAEWSRTTPWLVGCNFLPSYAINQLEMWQPETFDAAAIDRELAWAESLGFNSVRVFLHDLLWEQDRDGFLKRLDTFLGIAERHRIGAMFVLFDGVWDPFPKLGPQRPPTPHRHNSGWVQSPGVDILKDPARHDALEGYVKGVVGRFKDDRRVQVWDLFNEPDNPNANSYGKHEPSDKPELAAGLVKKVARWARDAEPSQPLTLGVWRGAFSREKADRFNRLLIETSDVVSFHCYDDPKRLEAAIAALKDYGRPLLCTEYMARGNGSHFEPSLAIFKKAGIAAYNWGFVAGRSQTNYPWDSWTRVYTAEPPVWFHDIFRADGTPYRPDEVAYIRRLTGLQGAGAGGGGRR